MGKERRFFLLLKRFLGPSSTLFLCAAIAITLAIVMPKPAHADSNKLKVVINDLLERQAALELSQIELENQISSLEASLKEESKRAQLADEIAQQEAERQAARDNYIVATVAAAVVTTIAGGGQSSLPSEVALYNAKLILGDAIYESIQAGDYIFLDALASNAIDTDGDGIPDGIDFCPYNYGSLALMGCPDQYSD